MQNHGEGANLAGEVMEQIDLGEVIPPSGVQIHASERLRFARQVLLWMALICIGVIAAYICWPDNKAAAEAFELVKIGALPLVTLVISFYFPSNANGK